jgi:RNA polymerase sigma-70 factor, ECF subfamily
MQLAIAGPARAVARPAFLSGVFAVFAAMLRPAARRPRSVADGANAADPSASFDHLVLRHLDAAYSLARFLTRDADAAEDLVQDAVLKAYRGFDGFRGGDGKAWLLTIVRREVFDWFAARRDAGRVFAEPETPGVEHVACEAADPEDLLLRKGDVGAVRRAIETLPEAFRESVVLRELEELSYREIAQVTGVPVGTVMSRLARGRDLLAEALRPGPLAMAEADR